MVRYRWRKLLKTERGYSIMNDDQQAERELEQKVIELARMKLSELQYSNFILEANLSKRMQEVTENETEILKLSRDKESLTNQKGKLSETISEKQELINTLKEEANSYKEQEKIDSDKILEDNKELQRKLELVVEHRNTLEEELQQLKNPYETVIELEPVVETVVHEGQLELNLLDAIRMEEPQPKEETWEEGTMLESIDGTNN
jgi:chromosome segregation ATPase